MITSLLFYFALCVFVTYAITASALFMPLRIAVAVRSHWLSTLIYCPVCTGFWIALVFGWLYPEDVVLLRFIYGPVFFIAGLVALRAQYEGFLVSSAIDDEWRAIADIVARRGVVEEPLQ